MKAIVIGYPGIGKSTLSDKDKDFIDLESSMFHEDDRPEVWEYIYCNVAINLASQGYVVLTSSHEKIRDYLITNERDLDIPVFTCFPSYKIQKQWINRLQERYHTDMSAKNLKAYLHAFEMFEKDVREFRRMKCKQIEIDDMNYDLGSLLKLSIRSSERLHMDAGSGTIPSDYLEY